MPGWVLDMTADQRTTVRQATRAHLLYQVEQVTGQATVCRPLAPRDLVGNGVMNLPGMARRAVPNPAAEQQARLHTGRVEAGRWTQVVNMVLSLNQAYAIWGYAAHRADSRIDALRITLGNARTLAELPTAELVMAPGGRRQGWLDPPVSFGPQQSMMLYVLSDEGIAEDEPFDLFGLIAEPNGLVVVADQLGVLPQAPGGIEAARAAEARARQVYPAPRPAAREEGWEEAWAEAEAINNGNRARVARQRAGAARPRRPWIGERLGREWRGLGRWFTPRRERNGHIGADRQDGPHGAGDLEPRRCGCDECGRAGVQPGHGGGEAAGVRPGPERGAEDVRPAGGDDHPDPAAGGRLDPNVIAAVGPGEVVAGWRLLNFGNEPVTVGIQGVGGPVYAHMIVPATSTWDSGIAVAYPGPLEVTVMLPDGRPAEGVVLELATGTNGGGHEFRHYQRDTVPQPPVDPAAAQARAHALLDDTLGTERSALLRAGRLPILSHDRPGLAYLIDPTAAGVHVFVDTLAHPDLPRECRGWAPDPGDCLPGREAFQALAWLCVHPAGYANGTLPLDDQLLALYLACTAGETEMWRQANPGPVHRRDRPVAPYRRGQGQYGAYPNGEPAGIFG